MVAELIDTGTICKFGHSAPRYAKSRRCVQCTREDNSKQMAKNKEGRLRAARNWRHKNRGYANERAAAYRKDNPERTLLTAARKTAKAKNVAFNLEIADIEIPDVCPVLGIVLARASGCRTGSSPSLDRVKPALGYVKGNVMVISWRANRIKADATFEELAAVADFYGKLATKN